MSSGRLTGTYVFGSVGRGDQDSKSDLDILAVVENRTGKVSDSVVLAHIPIELRSLKPSISWYGGDRVREMFRNGELFAWHIYKETIPLFDPQKFVSGLGRPAEYREFVADVSSFHHILTGIPSQIALNKNNAIYEAGLIYVCLRNMAMAASWALCEFPDFSRHSPFRLVGVSACPISAEEYELAMACRMASQRGLAPPPCVSREFVIEIFDRLDPWVQELHSILQRKDDRGRQL